MLTFSCNQQVPADVALHAQVVVEVEQVAPALAHGRERYIVTPPPQRTAREGEVEARAARVGGVGRDRGTDEEPAVVVEED